VGGCAGKGSREAAARAEEHDDGGVDAGEVGGRRGEVGRRGSFGGAGFRKSRCPVERD
jgi:hypothetical protein